MVRSGTFKQINYDKKVWDTLTITSYCSCIGYDIKGAENYSSDGIQLMYNPYIPLDIDWQRLGTQWATDIREIYHWEEGKRSVKLTSTLGSPLEKYIMIYVRNNIFVLKRFLSNVSEKLVRQQLALNIFDCNFLNENVWISIKISLKFVPRSN